MRAEQIMTTEVMTVHANTTVEEVARLLTTRRIGSMPVVDDDQRVLGVVNDDDLFTSEKGIPFSAVRVPVLFEKWAQPDRAVEIYANARQNTAQDVMSYEFVCVDVNASVGYITQVMVERNLHRVLVTRSDRLAGIITRLDLIRMLANSG
jgi:CBS domain-containing protein